MILADYALGQGYSVELFYCASDPALDGIVFPRQRAGVVDARHLTLRIGAARP